MENQFEHPQPSTKEIEEMMTEEQKRESERREKRMKVPNDTLEIEHDGNVFEVKLDFVWPDVPEEDYYYFSSDIEIMRDEFNAPFGEDVAEEIIAQQERIPISWQEYKLCFFGSDVSLSEKEIEAIEGHHVYHGAASKRNFVEYPVLYYSDDKWQLRYEDLSKIKKSDNSRVVSILDKELYEKAMPFETDCRERGECEEERVKKYLETLTDKEKEILNKIIESDTYEYEKGQCLPEIWGEAAVLKMTKEEKKSRELVKKIRSEMTKYYLSDVDNDTLAKILDEKLSKIPHENREDIKKRVELDQFMTDFSNIEFDKEAKAKWEEEKMRHFPWRHS